MTVAVIEFAPWPSRRWLYSRKFILSGRLAHLYVLCKGEDENIGRREWKIETQAA
jgi:hypothetical protein